MFIIETISKNNNHTILKIESGSKVGIYPTNYYKYSIITVLVLLLFKKISLSLDLSLIKDNIW